MTPSELTMHEVRRSLDPQGNINRWQVKAIGKKHGLEGVNHLYATSAPRMVRVPGTPLGRPV
jgi:hypothetical protein